MSTWFDGQPVTWQGLHLWWLWIFWPVLLVLLLLARRKRLADWSRLVPVQSRGGVWLGEGLGSRRPVLLVAVGAAAALVALMRPAWGYRLEQHESQALSVIVALDVSDSMLAGDVAPSRLEQARRDVLDLFERAQGERFGIVTFAGSAFVESPLTEDLSALRDRLMAIDPGLLPVAGSRLDLAIYRSLELLGKKREPLAEVGVSSESEPAPVQDTAAVVVFSDGEADASSSLAAVAEARKRGVRVFTVGLGTEQGAPVPDLRRSGQFRRNAAGGLVTSRIDASLLGRLAAQGRGLYVASQASDRDMVSLYDRGLRALAARRAAPGTPETVQVPREIFQLPLLVAVIALLCEWVLGRPRESRLRLRRTARLGLFFTVWAASLGPAYTALAADSLGTLHRRAKQHFAEGQFAEAALAWKQRIAAASADTGGAPAEDYYNLGAALYRSGDFDGAAQALRLALSKALRTQAQGATPHQTPQSLKLSQADGSRLADMLHNLGNAELRAGRAREAVQAYEKSLELRPRDTDTAANLQVARELLAQQSQQPPAGSEGSSPERGKPEQQGQDTSQQQAGAAASSGSKGQSEDPNPSSQAGQSSSSDAGGPSSKQQQGAGLAAGDDARSEGPADRRRAMAESGSGKPRDKENVDAARQPVVQGEQGPERAHSGGDNGAGNAGHPQRGFGQSPSKGPSDVDATSLGEARQGQLSAAEVNKTLNRISDDARAYRQGRARLEAEQQLQRYGAPQGGRDW